MTENITYKLISTEKKTELFAETVVFDEELNSPLYFGYSVVMDGEGDLTKTKLIRTTSYFDILNGNFPDGETALQEAVKTTITDETVALKYSDVFDDLIKQTHKLSKKIINNTAPWPDIICK